MGSGGIPAAAAAGIVAGDEQAGLMVIDRIMPSQREEIQAFLNQVPISVTLMENCDILDISVTVRRGEEEACARLNGTHTGISRIPASYRR